MKVFRLITAKFIFSAIILVFGCLSCYAVPHDLSDAPCHLGQHHSKDCNACSIAQKAWNLDLITNPNQQTIKESPNKTNDPPEIWAVSESFSIYSAKNFQPQLIVSQKAIPLRMVVKTIVWRL